MALNFSASSENQLHSRGRDTIVPSIAAIIVSAGLLTIVKLKAPYEMLLADRYISGAGWIEIVLLAGYAGWLTSLLQRSSNTAKIRVRIWLTFSIVFFLQFILGVAGVEGMLMTGRLHVPVPAVVIAGPIFRGERFFMPILFLSTVVLVGPAWCSHLCYIGAWDGLAATRRKRATRGSQGWRSLRIAIFLLTPLTAIVLRMAGASGALAGYVAIGFGIVSLGVMAFVSRRMGRMVHCTAICPLGLAGNLLGKISPFRIRIGSSCNDCGRCVSTCRYDALDLKRIASRKPGNSCTLCGDCLPSCDEGALGYRFARLDPRISRALFLVIIVSLHAVFLGVARI